MATADIEIEFEVSCEDCGQSLKATGFFRQGVLDIDVQACPVCTDKAYRQGLEEGEES